MPIIERTISSYTYILMHTDMYTHTHTHTHIVKLTCKSFPGLGFTPALSTRMSIWPNCLMTWN